VPQHSPASGAPSPGLPTWSFALIWITGLALLWAWMASGSPAPGGYAALLGRVEFFVAGVWLSALASIMLAVIAFHV
jgi:hypothetical protein